MVSLHGKRILVTREEKQGRQFAAKIRQYGGVPIEVPLLQISCKDHQENITFFKQLANYKWIFFTSSNGVHCFFKLADSYQIDTQFLKTVTLAAVGHKTGDALKNHGFNAAFIPSVYNAEVMAKEFFQVYNDVSPVLIVRGSKSLDILPAAFESRSIKYDAMEVYETGSRMDMKSRLNDTLNTGEIDFITFTSPSSVEAYRAMAQVNLEVPVVCIGTTTEKRAKQLDFQSILVPEEFTIDGMIHRLGKYLSKKELDE
ncbi:uroporphyrinogen-III synthase [Virgibacillus kimchii]